MPGSLRSGRLPNLLVAGVPKAGTGSLFAYLTQHPDMCRGDQEEVGFLNYYNPLRHSGEPPPIKSYMARYTRCGQQRYAIVATPRTSTVGSRSSRRRKKSLSGQRSSSRCETRWTGCGLPTPSSGPSGNLTSLPTFEEYVSACRQRKRDGTDLVPRDHLHGLYIDTAVTETMDLAPRNKTMHARRPHMAKMVFSLKRSVDRLGRLHPALRGSLRRAYERINAGEAPERLSPDMRRQMEDLYRDSNQATAQLLAAHGYRDLPAWLRVAVRD